MFLKFVLILTLNYSYEAFIIEKYYPKKIETNKSSNITIIGQDIPFNFKCFLSNKEINHYIIANGTKIKCEVPSILFEFRKITLNIKYFTENGSEKVITLPKKIIFLHYPILSTMFPMYLPSTGGYLWFIGDNLPTESMDILIYLDNNWSFNCSAWSDIKIACLIPEMPSINYYEYNVTIVMGNTTLSYTNKIHFYGVFYITPNRGPLEQSCNIYVNGFGFSSETIAACKLSDYTIDAVIINSSFIMCNSSISIIDDEEKYNHFIHFTIRVMHYSERNSSLFYEYDANSLWVLCSTTFYVYISANASEIEPTRVNMNELVNISIYSSSSWSFKNALVGTSPLPTDVVSSYFADQIYCRFEDFGLTKAYYIEENLIKCSTPEIKTNLAMIYEVEKSLELAFNGETFIVNTNAQITFVGSMDPLLYTWILVGLFVGIVAMIGFVFFAINFLKKREKINVN